MYENIDLYRYPRNFFLNVTGSCNLKCNYCSSEGFNENLHIKKKDLEHIIDELKALGSFQVVVTGGEPLLHPDIKWLINKLISFTLVTLNTNGVYLDNFIEFFKGIEYKSRLNINVSLDSLIPENNALTRGEYDIEKIIDTIKQLSTYGYYMTILCTATDLITDKDLLLFMNFIKENPDIHFDINDLKSNGRAIKHWKSLRPSIEKIKLIHNITNIRIIDFDYNGNEIKDDICSILTCGAGKQCISIASDGNIYPCTAMHLLMGNIFEKSIKEIFDTSPVKQQLDKLRKEKLNVLTECKACEHIYECYGGCRANAYNVNENLYDIDPYCWHKGIAYMEEN